MVRDEEVREEDAAILAKEINATAYRGYSYNSNVKTVSFQ